MWAARTIKKEGLTNHSSTPISLNTIIQSFYIACNRLLVQTLQIGIQLCNQAGVPETYDTLRQEWEGKIKEGVGAEKFTGFVMDTSIPYRTTPYTSDRILSHHQDHRSP